MAKKKRTKVMSAELYRATTLYRLRIKNLLGENQELYELFDLQHKRCKEAEAYWRKHTKQKNFMIPDLGGLLQFLMKRIWELEQMKAPLKRMKL